MIKAVVFDYGAVLNKRLRLQRQLFKLAAELRAQNVKTGILSNMPTSIGWFVKLRGSLSEFDPLLFSSEIGVSKPDPRAYEILVKRIGLPPSQILFVDNREDNIEGAKKTGLRTVLVSSTDQAVHDIKNALKKSA